MGDDTGRLPPSNSAGFDNRIVSYEIIHQIDEASKQALVKAVDPKPDDIILDGMSGYGAVTKWILDSARERGFTPNVYTVDESPVQVQREEENLPELPHDHIHQCDIRKTPFQDKFFDTIVIKMGVHELPQGEQSKVFSEVFRLLKPSGKFVIWELSLNSENQQIFQDIIRKKDELAGFKEMVIKRYFPRHDELQNLFQGAGFADITDCHDIRYRPSTLARKEELISKEKKQLIERHGQLTDEGMDLLEQLGSKRAALFTAYARTQIPEDIRVRMKYEDKGDDVSFEVEKVIMSGIKPVDN